MVGDIGGTNARLSLWVTDGREHEEVFKETYQTNQYAQFEDVIQEFLREPTVSSCPPQAAALAVAGAVEDNRCPMTRISWVVDGNQLTKDLNIRVAVLNDFEAAGYGIPALKAEDIHVLNEAPAIAKAPKVVLGPGTGLGAAQLMWDEGLQRYKVWPGEGAHATFAPRGWKQTALSEYATTLHGHCEIEEVCCGSGLSLIYEFLRSDEVAHNPRVLKNSSPKTAAEITAGALSGEDPLAREAVDMFLAILGAEAGQMALRCLARGGVYIAGGIAPRVLDIIQEGGLLEGFLNKKGKPRFHEILKTIPLYVVTNTRLGVIGSREYALGLIQ